MLKTTIHNLDLFENFLTIISKFVQQCEFDIYTDKVNVYCVNPRDFSSARLLLNSNVITLDEKQKYSNIKVYIRDIIALRSSISIIKQVEDVSKISLFLEEIDNGENVLVKSIKYRSKSGGKFNLITVDKSVIIDYVSKELHSQLDEDLKFNILPKNLDILQNRTNNIINLDEISVYIYPNEEKNIIMLNLMSKESSSMNSIGLPISTSYEGSLDGFPYSEIAIHESSFRILNILRTTNEEDLNCFFNIDNNVFMVKSKINVDNYYIKSRLLIQMIKGK